jgi:tetratricopeptide (TPR) repeat protein
VISVVSTWDGRKAHALRIAFRLTNEAFADRLGVASRAVAKWDAQPDLVPVMNTQQILDLALDRAPDEVKTRFELLLAELKSETRSPLDELHVTALPMTVQLPTVSLRHATPETLIYLRNTLNSHYTADNLLGPRALLPVITAHVDAIEQLLQGAAGATYDELLRVGAGYAEFAGWLCQDSGDLGGAAVWCDRALEWAQAGGDERMAAFVMTRRAVQSISAGKGTYAVRLAMAAQRGGDRPETIHVRALAAMTEANGHAISGEPSETDRALDVTDALLERESIVTDGDPMQGRYCELDLYLKITRAKCHLELGRANDAVEAFDVVLADLPADYHRDRGQYLARLAQAHIMAEQPEPACVAAEESLAIAISTGSGRTITELRTMTKKLARWMSQPMVERFCGMLMAVEPTNGGA